METVTVFKEGAEALEEAGGRGFDLCFQCALCTVSCPWNKVRNFMLRRLLRQAQFGLVELGDEDWWWEMRWMAEVLGVTNDPAVALGAIGDPRAVEPLIRALGDEGSLMRKEAAVALGAIGNPRAVEPLLASLKDENSYVRATSAWALGEIGDRRAMDALIAALGEESHGVRKNSLLALKKMTGQDLGPDPAAWQAWWEKNK